uniref:Uncharacterized protein n=1 Tax=Meloidogyne hapla TaxID=6305 RepID=A0A1I8BAB2_MELHA
MACHNNTVFTLKENWQDENLQEGIIKIWEDRRLFCIDIIYDWLITATEDQIAKLVEYFEHWLFKTKKLVEKQMKLKGKEAENQLKNLENLKKEWKRIEPPIIEIMKDCTKIKNNKNKLSENEMKEYKEWQKKEFEKNINELNEQNRKLEEDKAFNIIKSLTKDYCDHYGLSLIKKNDNNELDKINNNNNLEKEINEDIKENKIEENKSSEDYNEFEQKVILLEQLSQKKKNYIFFNKLIGEDEILIKHYKNALFNGYYRTQILNMNAANFISFVKIIEEAINKSNKNLTKSEIEAASEWNEWKCPNIENIYYKLFENEENITDNIIDKYSYFYKFMALLYNYLDNLKNGIENNFEIKSLNELGDKFLNEENEEYFNEKLIETDNIKKLLREQNFKQILKLQNCEGKEEIGLKEGIKSYDESIVIKELEMFVSTEQANIIITTSESKKENEYCIDDKLKDKNHFNNDEKLAFHYREALFNENKIEIIKHKYASDFIVWHRAIIKQLNNLQNWPNQRVRNNVLNAWKLNENEKYFCLLFTDNKNLFDYGTQLFPWFEEMKLNIEKRQKRGEFSKGEKTNAVNIIKDFKIIKNKCFVDKIYKGAKKEFINWLHLEHNGHLNELIFVENDYGEELKMKAIEEISKDPLWQKLEYRRFISKEMASDLITRLNNLKNNNSNSNEKQKENKNNKIKNKEIELNKNILVEDKNDKEEKIEMDKIKNLKEVKNIIEEGQSSNKISNLFFFVKKKN